jgi:hypothetical protein
MLLELMQQYAPALMDNQKPELQSMMQGLVDEVKAILPKAVREGHIKSLVKNPVPKPRADEYSELKWFVCETAQTLILGDTGCLFDVVGKRRYKSIDDKGDDITNIFLQWHPTSCCWVQPFLTSRKSISNQSTKP